MINGAVKGYRHRNWRKLKVPDELNDNKTPMRRGHFDIHWDTYELDSLASADGKIESRLRVR